MSCYRKIEGLTSTTPETEKPAGSLSMSVEGLLGLWKLTGLATARLYLDPDGGPHVHPLNDSLLVCYPSDSVQINERQVRLS